MSLDGVGTEMNNPHPPHHCEWDMDAYRINKEGGGVIVGMLFNRK